MESLQPARDDAPDTLDRWLRACLGRRAVVGLLVSAREATSGADALALALGAYSEIWLPRPASGPAREMLVTLLAADPDLLLIWSACALERAAWVAEVLAALEEVGRRDRWAPLLVGPGVTRASARALGCEDGFADERSAAAIAAAVARGALASEVTRRQGSSPPCYLG